MSEFINENELDELFDSFEEDTKFDSTFLQMKQGDKQILFMLPPIEHNGKPTIKIEVEGEYDGKPTKQWIMRFTTARSVGSNVSFDDFKLVGVLMNRTMCNELIGFHRQGFQLTCTKDNPDQATPLLLMHDGKRKFQPSPKTKTLPSEVLEAANDFTWEFLLESYAEMQEAFSKKKKTADTDTPW